MQNFGYAVAACRGLFVIAKLTQLCLDNILCFFSYGPVAAAHRQIPLGKAQACLAVEVLSMPCHADLSYEAFQLAVAQGWLCSRQTIVIQPTQPSAAM